MPCEHGAVRENTVMRLRCCDVTPSRHQIGAPTSKRASFGLRHQICARRQRSPADSIDPYMFSLAPLLVHSDHLSPTARGALKAAVGAAPEQQRTLLESAARILHSETNLDCSDVRELVG